MDNHLDGKEMCRHQRYCRVVYYLIYIDFPGSCYCPSDRVSGMCVCVCVCVCVRAHACVYMSVCVSVAACGVKNHFYVNSIHSHSTIQEVYYNIIFPTL